MTSSAAKKTLRRNEISVLALLQHYQHRISDPTHSFNTVFPAMQSGLMLVQLQAKLKHASAN